MGVIVAIKKRYKFFFLKDLHLFCQLDNDNKQLIKEEGTKFRRVSVGICYGRPATFLDAANYVKEEWDKVADETIKNAFIKSDFIKIRDTLM